MNSYRRDEDFSDESWWVVWDLYNYNVRHNRDGSGSERERKTKLKLK